MQTWTPKPKERCRSILRSTSRVSGVGELALVATGGGGEQHDGRAFGDDLVVPGHVLGGDAGERHRGWFVAEDLLDRVRDQVGPFHELRPLVGVLSETWPRPIR